MSKAGRIMCLLWLLILAAASWSFDPAEAHFNVEAKNRVFIIDRHEDSIRIFIRIPTPLIFAREINMRASSDDPVIAPFVDTEADGIGYLYYLDLDAIRADPETFGLLAASGYRFTVGGRIADPRYVSVRVYRESDKPAFATVAEAETAVTGEGATVTDRRLFVGDTSVDLELILPDVAGYAPMEIVSTLPAMPAESNLTIDNHFIDVRGDRIQVTNVPGEMLQPVLIDSSALRAAQSFVVQGILHIIEGPDHVLFVLCLTIGAISIGRLLWQVTGFTVGHSITLIAGFFGYTPHTVWFTPAVETAIALSIIYAGLMALWRPGTLAAVPITVLIGLLHGFGFSFVLSEILGPSSPHLLVSLLSFNVGVEIGQLVIVSLTLAVLALAGWFSGRLATAVRVGAAVASILVAGIWVVQRTDLLVATVNAAG